LAISSFDTYQALARRTAGDHPEFADRVTNWVLGLAGEAGEIADRWKKVLYHGHPFDKDAMVEELGDLLWYAAMLSDALGLPLSEVAARNIEKLRARYPDGFSSERSIHRTT